VKIVIAPDSFKGGPSATLVAEAIAAGWRRARPSDELVSLPMADGGEGTLDALGSGIAGARRCPVASLTGPDGRFLDGEYLRLPDGTAVVEMASVSGLPLMDDLDPLGATSRGVGQVILAALDDGAERLVLGVGGSASTDGGTGALAALGARFLDADGGPIEDGGGALHSLSRIDLTALRPAPPGGMEILTDVTSPLLGPHGSAAIFGPQKGADARDVELLEAGLTRLATQLGGDPAQPGAGAAGGIAYGFATTWGAELRLGSRAIAEELGLQDALARADLVITGEGRLDATSLDGKVVSTVLELAAEAGVAAGIVAGGVDPELELDDGTTVLSLTELAGSAQRSLGDPARFLREAGARLAAHHPHR